MVDQPDISGDGKTTARRGCSCWTALLVLVSLLFAAGIMAYFALENFLQKEALSKLTPAEQTNFNTWLEEPLLITKELLQPGKPTPPELTKMKREFNELTDQLEGTRKSLRWSDCTDTLSSDSMVIFKNAWPQPNAFCNLEDKLLLNLPLTTTETTILDTAMHRLKAYGMKADALANYPAYTFHSADYVDEISLDLSLYQVPELLGVYAYSQFAAGNNTAAIDTFTTIAKLMAHEPYHTVDAFAVVHSLTVAGNISKTSDVKALRRLRKVLKESSGTLLHTHQKLEFAGGPLGPAVARMVETGYLKSPPVNRRECFDLVLFISDFDMWIKGNSSLSVSAKKAVEAGNDGFYYNSFYGMGGLFKKADVGVLKPAVRGLFAAVHQQVRVNYFNEDKEKLRESAIVKAQFDELLSDIEERIRLLSE